MAMHTDPVCGMKVDDEKSAVHSSYEGKKFYFCGTACSEKFEANPQQFASQKATA